MKKHIVATFALVAAVSAAACVQPADEGTRDLDEHTAAEPAAAVAADAAVQLEQAERALDVGRDVAGARAALAALVADKDTPADVRTRASMALSRAAEKMNDAEGAVRAVEDLLAAHGEEARWAGQDAAERRLRKLLTGKEETDSLRGRHMERTSPFAAALGHYFKHEGKEPLDVSVVTLGNDGHTAQDLGTFNIGDALRERAQEECVGCEDGLKVRSSYSQTSSWTSIPALKARMDAAVVAFYTHLGDPIPARYDELLPVPMAEVTAHLQKGEGLIVAKERKGAPPVLLIAAPREAQLPEVEKALSVMEKVPVSKVVVNVSPSLTPDEIKSVMRRSVKPALAKCYEGLLARKPGASGRLVLSFAVQPGGEPADLEVTGTEALDDAGVRQCAAGALDGIRFAATGARTTVRYPFLFSPGE